MAVRGYHCCTKRYIPDQQKLISFALHYMNEYKVHGLDGNKIKHLNYMFVS